jgi:hypothetical protein
MPVIPSFSLGSNFTRPHQSTVGDTSSPDRARATPQPPSARRNSNPSPRLAVPVTRRHSSDAASHTRTSDTSAASPGGRPFTSRFDSAASSSSAVEDHRGSARRGTSHSTGPPSRRRLSPPPNADSDGTWSRSRSAEVPLFTGEEAAAVSPGRRFMNMHRRARRERARNAGAYALYSSPIVDDTRSPNAVDDIGHDDMGVPTGGGASTAPSRDLGGAATTTGAFLRRAQYAAPTRADHVEAGQQQQRQARGTHTWTSLDARPSGRSPGEARLGTPDSLVQSSGPLTGRDSERDLVAEPAATTNIVPRADITILVAPPQVQLTTSRDALRRLTRDAYSSAPPHSSPMPGCGAPSSAPATSSGSLVPTTPLGSHGRRRGVARSDARANPTFRRWQRAASSSDEDEDVLPAASEGGESNAAAPMWQLPVLIAASRGHVAHLNERDYASSLGSASDSSRSGERGPSFDGRAEHADSHLRSTSQNSDSGAAGSPYTAPLRSFGAVSFAQGVHAVRTHEDSFALRSQHFVAVPPSSSDEQAQRDVSLSSPSGAQLSSALLRGARGSAAASSASSLSSALVGSVNRTPASLMLSWSTSSFAAAADTATPHPRRQQPVAARDARSHHGGADVRTVAAEDGGGGSTGVVVMGSGGARECQHASRPASPVLVPALNPAGVPETSETAAQAEVFPIPFAHAAPPSATVPHTSDAAGAVNTVQLPIATDGVVLLNHVRNVPAQGELYRLLRVFHREPLRQFPQALPGPPLAVRLPEAYNSGNEGDDDDDDMDGWDSDVEEGGDGGRRRRRSHSSHRNSFTASDPAVHASRPTAALENQPGHPSRRRRSRSLHSTLQGHSSSSSSRQRSRSTSLSSASPMMVEVSANNPRELFTRLVSDPADRRVEVRGLSSVPSSELFTSPHRSRGSRATRNSTHRISEPSIVASRTNADGSHGDAEEIPSHHARHTRSDSGTPARTRRPRLTFSDHSLPAESPFAASAAGTVGTSVCQAEVVANGFFNADIRLTHARAYAEAVSEAELAYGKGCYYTLPLTPFSSSPPRTQKLRAASDAMIDNTAPAMREVAPGAERRTSISDADEVMELLPRLNTVRTTSSCIQRNTRRCSASTITGGATGSAQAAHSNASTTSRENTPPSRLSPEPPRSVQERLDLPNPRLSSLRSPESPNENNSSSPITPASKGTPQAIRGTSTNYAQSSFVSNDCADAGATVGEYAPMTRISSPPRTPTRRSRYCKGVDNR